MGQGLRARLVVALFYAFDSQAIVVLEPDNKEAGPTAKLVSMEDGSVQDVDVYGNGPPVIIPEDSDGEGGSPVEVPLQSSVDKIIQVRVVDQMLRGAMQRMLVCLYDSNRLV